MVAFLAIGIYAFFPCKYRNHIEKICNNTPIAPHLVYAVIRCESSFDINKVSNKGAVGLMQIMPKTSDYISKLYFADRQFNLFNPSDNVLLGITYLTYLFDKFKDEKVVLAAYNAGEGRVCEWLDTKEFSIDGKTLKVIPFKETANYVEKVLLYKNFYKILWP